MSASTQQVRGNNLSVPATPNVVTTNSYARKFICPDESLRYALSLEDMVFKKLKDSPHATVIEFGSGEGHPVIKAMLNSGFSGIVHGYEINAEAAEAATKLIAVNHLNRNYVVYNENFFDSVGIPKAE